jgi:hypothetical protein
VSKGVAISRDKATTHYSNTVSTYGVVSQYDIGAVKTLDNIDENTFFDALVPPVTVMAQKEVRMTAC